MTALLSINAIKQFMKVKLSIHGRTNSCRKAIHLLKQDSESAALYNAIFNWVVNSSQSCFAFSRNFHMNPTSIRFAHRVRFSNSSFLSLRQRRLIKKWYIIKSIYDLTALLSWIATKVAWFEHNVFMNRTYGAWIEIISNYFIRKNIKMFFLKP